jgi:hypothetical protein
VILVCHEAIYGLDLEKNRLGLVYNRRTAMDGSVDEKLKQAIDAASAAATQLEVEPEFAGKLRFDRTQWEVAVNDRALAPNNAATLAALEPTFQQVFAGVLAGTPRVVHNSGPGELFRVKISAA